MTNKERLLAMLGFQPEVNAAEAVLIDNSLVAADTYVTASLSSIRLAAISLLETLLSTPNTSNSVTGYSVTYDRAAIERRLNNLKTEAGLITGPTINVVNKW